MKTSMQRPTLLGTVVGILIVLWVYAQARMFQLRVEFVENFSWVLISHRALADACLVLLSSLLLAVGIRRFRHRLSRMRSAFIMFVGTLGIAYFSWQCASAHLRFNNLKDTYAHPIEQFVMEDRFIDIMEDAEQRMRLRTSIAYMHAESIYEVTGYKAPIVNNEGELEIYQPHSEFSRNQWIEILSDLDNALAYNTSRSMIALPIIAAFVMFGFVAPLRTGSLVDQVKSEVADPE